MSANPLAAYPASVRLRSRVIPTAQVMDNNGALATALMVSGLEDYPASSDVDGDSISGDPIFYANIGEDLSGVAPGSIANLSGKWTNSPVQRVIEGFIQSYCRTYIHNTTTNGAIIGIQPGADMAQITVGQKVSGLYIPSGSTVVATPDDNPVISMDATTTSASTNVTVADTSTLKVGMSFTSPKVTSVKYIVSITNGTTFVINSSSGVSSGSGLSTFIFDLIEESSQEIQTTGASTTVTCEDTSRLRVGQLIYSTKFPGRTAYISAITSAVQFTASTTASSTGTETAEFGALVAISAGASTTGTGINVSFGGWVEMSDNAGASGSSVTVTFTGNGNSLSDVLDGAYCILAIPIVWVSGESTGSYIMAYGYVRFFNEGMARFYLWQNEDGSGSPVSELTVPEGFNNLLMAASSGYFIVAITNKMDFSCSAKFQLRGRMNSDPPLVWGPEAIRFKTSSAGITGRATAGYILGLDTDQYLSFRSYGIIGRLTAAPDATTVEKDIELTSGSIKGRMSALPPLVGGYLNAGGSDGPVRAAIYQGRLIMYSNGEDIHPADVTLTGRTPTAKLTGANQFRSNVPIRGLVNSRAKFMLQGRGLTVRDAVALLGQLWYKRSIDYFDTDARGKAMESINGALQTIYSRARHLDYFNKAEISVTVTAASNTVALSSSIQTVLGNVRVDDADQTPLFSLQSKQEVAQAPLIYGTEASGTPQFYFIDGANTAEWDNVSLTLMVAPTPTENTSIKLDAAIDAPRYTWTDVELSTPLQLPHAYAETIFMPLVRYYATNHRLFLDKDSLPLIREQHKKALIALGLVAPEPKQAAKPQTEAAQGTE